MVITKRDLTAAAQRAVKRLRAEADAALVEAGRAAKRRQRRRAVKATLKAAGTAALVAGAAAATAVAARAVVRRVRGPEGRVKGAGQPH